MLESAVDGGRLRPGEKGWKERQVELVEGHLISPDESGATPLARIHAARRESWLERVPGEDQALLTRATPTAEWSPSAEEAAAAVEPLHWLLGRLAEGVKLTQTGALSRALVREAVERYPDWWDSELFGPPHREADVYPLEVLHTFIEELRLARPRKGVLTLRPRGRTLRLNPAALLTTVASTIASAGASSQLALALADLLSSEDVGEEVDFRLVHLLGPFYGIVGGRFRKEAHVTAGGRTLAAAILHELAYGPRHSFA
jgi:hypothetical protein